MVLPKKGVPITVFLLVLICSETQSKRTKKIKTIHKLPSYFPVCYRNDPALNECLLKATDQVRPYLVKGVPEIRIPPFEPFVLPEINLELGTNSLNYKSVLKNIIVHGLTKYEFTRFDFDVPNLQFFCDFQVPGLQMEGNYSVSGRILGTPIEGSGKFTASLDSCKCNLYQQYKETTLADGKIHIAPAFTNGTFEVSGPKSHLEGLFNGNEELNAVINRVINDNNDELFAELQPVLEKTLFKVAEDLVFKTITSNIPFDDLYPIKK